MAKAKIKIVEVGPRDGLQNEANQLTVDVRTRLVEKLVEAGEKYIEVGSFVSPQWVPQMSNTDKIVKKLESKKTQKKWHSKVDFSVLVPNEKGMQLALQAGIKHIAIFGACSETFSKKNINCSISESFFRFQQIMKVARSSKVKVRGYLSTAFGCPYDGKVSQAKVVGLVEKMFELGVYEVSIGDTIGVATPKQVGQLLSSLEKNVPLKKIAMHFHDTRGTALANVLKSLEMGIRTFDASIGGLGGCPYAKGASGNLSTEDLVYMLHGMGFSTGTDLKKLIEVSRWAGQQIGRELPSKMAQAGSFPQYIVG